MDASFRELTPEELSAVSGGVSLGGLLTTVSGVVSGVVKTVETLVANLVGSTKQAGGGLVGVLGTLLGGLGIGL